MRIARIYVADNLYQNQSLTLSQEASHYLQHVLRVKVGTPIILFNGGEGEWPSSIKAISRQGVSVSVGDFKPVTVRSPCHIHLAQGVAKGEKMDWIIQKAVELGVSEITPLITEYSNVKLDDLRAAKRLGHWQKIAISACEQSGRTTLPIINPIIRFDQWVSAPNHLLKLMCDPESDSHLTDLAISSAVMVAIGPEGGFSTSELTTASHHGFTTISLGPRILRAETAAITSIAILQHRFGDLR